MANDETKVKKSKRRSIGTAAALFGGLASDGADDVFNLLSPQPNGTFSPKSTSSMAPIEENMEVSTSTLQENEIVVSPTADPANLFTSDDNGVDFFTQATAATNGQEPYPNTAAAVDGQEPYANNAIMNDGQEPFVWKADSTAQAYDSSGEYKNAQGYDNAQGAQYQGGAYSNDNLAYTYDQSQYSQYGQQSYPESQAYGGPQYEQQGYDQKPPYDTSQQYNQNQVYDANANIDADVNVPYDASQQYAPNQINDAPVKAEVNVPYDASQGYGQNQIYDVTLKAEVNKPYDASQHYDQNKIYDTTAQVGGNVTYDISQQYAPNQINDVPVKAEVNVPYDASQGYGQNQIYDVTLKAEVNKPYDASQHYDQNQIYDTTAQAGGNVQYDISQQYAQNPIDDASVKAEVNVTSDASQQYAQNQIHDVTSKADVNAPYDASQHYDQNKTYDTTAQVDVNASYDAPEHYDKKKAYDTTALAGGDVPYDASQQYDQNYDSSTQSNVNAQYDSYYGQSQQYDAGQGYGYSQPYNQSQPYDSNLSYDLNQQYGPAEKELPSNQYGTQQGYEQGQYGHDQGYSYGQGTYGYQPSNEAQTQAPIETQLPPPLESQMTATEPVSQSPSQSPSQVQTLPPTDIQAVPGKVELSDSPQSETHTTTRSSNPSIISTGSRTQQSFSTNSYGQHSYGYDMASGYTGSVTQGVQGAYVEQQQSAPVTSANLRTDDSTFVSCPDCKTSNKPTAKFCMECGYRLGALSRSTTPAEYGATQNPGPGLDGFRRAATTSPFMASGLNRRNDTSFDGGAFGSVGSYNINPYEHPRVGSTDLYGANNHQDSYVDGTIQHAYAPAEPTYSPEEDYLGRTAPGTLKPVVSFGFGGQIVVMFPQCVQRYTADASGFGGTPITRSTPGNVSIYKMLDIVNADKFGINSSFPGPILQPDAGRGGKKKKSDAIKWIDERVALSSSTAELLPENSADRRQLDDEILLWKLLKLMIENDGKLEGNTQLDDSICKLLIPSLAESKDDTANFVSAVELQSLSPTDTSEPVVHYEVRASALDAISNLLLKGDRDGAVKYAVSEKMWAHALVIASSMTKDAWKDVVSDFIRHELGTTSICSTVIPSSTKSSGREPLRVLYSLFAGNMHLAANEFLPNSSAHFPPPATPMTSVPPALLIETPHSNKFPSPPNNIGLGIQPSMAADLETLDRWKETVAMILANRTAGDLAALTTLGDSLASNGRIYAAHICYILSPQTSIQSGMDTSAARFILIGADHPLTAHRNIDAICASEIYEFALDLKAGSEFFAQPHLQAYKLAHAWLYADAGMLHSALKYCDAIIGAMRQYNKGSPYFHGVMLSAVREFRERLEQQPAEALSEAGSTWMPKMMARPTLDTLWGSLESKFNKFVAGDVLDESNNSRQEATPTNNEIGPFSHYSAITANSASVNLPQAISTPDTNIPSSVALSGSTYTPPSQHHSQLTSNRRAYSQTPESYGTVLTYGQETVSYGQDQGQNGTYYDSSYGQQQQQYQEPSYGLSEDHNSVPAATTVPTFYSTNDGGNTGGYEPYVPTFDVGSNETNEISNNKPAFEDVSDDLGLGNSIYKRKPLEEETGTSGGGEEFEPSHKEDAAAAAFRAAMAAEAEKKAKEEESKNEASKAGGWLTGWFKKKENSEVGPVKAKLGKQSSFIFDKELGRWINKDGGDDTSAPMKPPPPPRAVTASPSAMGGSNKIFQPPPSNTTVDDGQAGQMSRTSSMPSSLAPPMGTRRPASTSGKRTLRKRYVDIMNQPQ